MQAKYKISKEGDEWIVSIAKTGVIIGYFQHRHHAEEYRTAQTRADEQSSVMGEFNSKALMRELMAEFIAEMA